MLKLLAMKSKLYNTPHLIDSESFGWVEGVVNAQTEGVQLSIAGKEKNRERQLSYNEDTKVGVIDISGPLTYMEYEAMCGEPNASYQGIMAQFDQLIAAGAKTVVLDVDSPGGEAYGMMETGRYLRKQADKAGVNIIAYVDGLAASAGYGLAASAHEIIANPEAELGSIGVVVKLRNVNGAMKQMGVKDTYVYAGASKIPYDADGEFAEEFLGDIREKVNALYEAFTDYVAELQNISVDAVKATEAKTFLAEKAVEMGLATKTMTREGFFEYLADVVQSGDTMLRFQLTGKKEGAKMTAESLAKLEALEGSVASLTASLEETTSKFEAVMAELAEKNAALEAASASLEEANKVLAAIETEKAEAAAAAEAARVEKRKAALVEAVGEAEAETLYAALGNLEDAAYFAVIEKMGTKLAVEQKTDPAFQELGAGGDKGVENTSSLTQMIEEKYGRSALAD